MAARTEEIRQCEDEALQVKVLLLAQTEEILALANRSAMLQKTVPELERRLAQLEQS